MKKIILSSLFFLLLGTMLKAQILEPVHWSYASRRINAVEAVIFIKATIDPGWHIYSQSVKDGGPIKTSFVLTSSADYSPIGKTTEPKPVSRMEKAFGMEVRFFENSVIFQQKVKLKKKRVTVTGKLEYMTCNDQKCLPPDEREFNITIK